jgi:spermidine synthase
LDLIKDVLTNCRRLYPVAKYASISIPSYPCGQIGFVLAGKDKVMEGEGRGADRVCAGWVMERGLCWLAMTK